MIPDTTKYKTWTWKHPLMLHWIINPGLAINELFLGQRVPKVTLIEIDTNKPLAERNFIPCPHCNSIHFGYEWSHENKSAFGNWFGLYCNKCGGIIPCLRNLTSSIILTVTFPIWIWFLKTWKKNWLEGQKQKFSRPLKRETASINWVNEGLWFGSFMFVFMELIFPLVQREGLILSKILIGIVVWTLGGLLFGYTMKKLMKKI